MMQSQIYFFRQSLNKGCRLFTPGRAAMEAFKCGLLTLLHQVGGMENEEEAIKFVADILEETWLSPGYWEPKDTNSPVCFANAPDLRPGFDDTWLPEQSTPAMDASTGSLQDWLLPASADKREVIEETIQSIRQILRNNQSNQLAANALDMQIKELVYRLYGLGAKEITQVKGT